MDLSTITPLLADAEKRHYAVGAFNLVNAETCQAVIETAVTLRSPVMLITGPWEIPVLGAKMLTELARFTAREADVPVCLHLDHAADIDLVKVCIDAGFPSVMIDGSRYPFEENVALTRAVVELAHARGVTVEGELGAVGRVDDTTVEGAGEASLTDPGKAAEFVDRTGVDCLAVAIGNAHGLYRQQPVLDFPRLRDIRKTVSVPIVLHGGSGTSPEQLREAVQSGISKVNVASELSNAYMTTIANAFAKSGGKAWYGHVLVDVKAALREIVSRWMRQLDSVNRV